MSSFPEILRIACEANGLGTSGSSQILLKRLVFRDVFGDAQPIEGERVGSPEYVKRTVDVARKAVEEEKTGRHARTDRKAMAFALKCSPLNAVTLPLEAREAAAIPGAAAFYCFCYPVINDTITDDTITDTKHHHPILTSTLTLH